MLMLSQQESRFSADPAPPSSITDHNVTSISDVGSSNAPIGPSALPNIHAGSICELWCAIAMGALMKGIPPYLVIGYVSHARRALARVFDDDSAQTARAFMMAAYLHSLLGDHATFARYSAFATAILDVLPPKQEPKDVRYLTSFFPAGYKFRVWVRGDDRECGDRMKAYCGENAFVPEIRARDIMNDSDVCSVLLECHRLCGEAFFEDYVQSGRLRQHAGDEGSSETVLEHTHDIPFVRPSRPVCTELTGCNGDVQPSQPKDEPLSPGAATRGFVRKTLIALRRISAIVKQPAIQAGFGGLLFHGELSFALFLTFDTERAVESIKACTETYVRYPGLCRMPSCFHPAHCMLAATVEYDGRLYERLRNAYNSVKPGDYPEAPPRDEWTGIASICEHTVCRSQMNMVLAIASRRKVDHQNCFREPAPGARTTPGPQRSIFRTTLTSTGVPCA